MTEFGQIARAELVLTNAEGVARRTAGHLAGHGAQVTAGEGRWLIDFGHRRARLALDGARLTIAAEGLDASSLLEMRMDLADHLAEFAGPVRIDWQGATPAAERPPNFRLLDVAGITDLTPHMRRIRLRGAELARFDTMAALHCKLLLPPPDRSNRWPALDADGRYVAGNGIVRKYTIRDLDVAAGWMDIDFVLHAAPGPGSVWAAGARVGDQLGLIGPGGGGIPLAGDLLLAGDETALPAIARALTHLAPGTKARVLIERAHPTAEQPLAAPAGVSIRWLHQGAAAPGARLAAALAEAAPGPETLVWAACEFEGFKAIRTHLRRTLDHPRDRHLVTAYWRQGRHMA